MDENVKTIRQFKNIIRVPRMYEAFRRELLQND